MSNHLITVTRRRERAKNPGLEQCSSRISLTVSLALTLATSTAQAQEDVEWRHYAADRFSTRYSPADQINRANVDQLEIAWRWLVTDADPTEGQRSRSFVATPLMLGGKLYVATGENRVVALDPSTGEKLWVFDPKAYETGFLRAFEKATGELLWETEYDNAPLAPPMTYVHDGRQFIAFSCGGRGRDKELVVFALPKGTER